ncbi:MAG: hypothetical protein JWN64_153 [Parcubacteria group bacterium]|nr:hypothetical protein [Parcubacteria group bacterium]
MQAGSKRRDEVHVQPAADGRLKNDFSNIIGDEAAAVAQADILENCFARRSQLVVLVFAQLNELENGPLGA